MGSCFFESSQSSPHIQLKRADEWRKRRGRGRACGVGGSADLGGGGWNWSLLGYKGRTRTAVMGRKGNRQKPIEQTESSWESGQRSRVSCRDDINFASRLEE